MEQISFFADFEPLVPSLRDQIRDFLKIISNRMYLNKCIDQEIMEIEGAILGVPQKTGIIPEKLIASARTWISTHENLSAIQAIYMAAGI